MEIKDLLGLGFPVVLLVIGGIFIILSLTGSKGWNGGIFSDVPNENKKVAYRIGIAFIILGCIFGLAQLAVPIILKIPVTGASSQPTVPIAQQGTVVGLTTPITPTTQTNVSVFATSTLTIEPFATSSLIQTLTPSFTPEPSKTPTNAATVPAISNENGLGEFNLIKQDSSSWEHYTDHNAQAEISEISAGYCFTMTNSGSSGVWDVVLHQKNIKLKKGDNYRVAFIAFADPIKMADFRVMLYPDYQKQLAGNTINLTNSNQVFLDDFIVGGTGDYNIDLEFRVGGTTPGKVCISNVSLVDLTNASHQIIGLWGAPPTCKNNSVGMQNKLSFQVDSTQELWDKDGNSVGASKSSVTPGNWGSVGWSGNPPPSYTGLVKWLIIFTDPKNGKILAYYPGSANIDCTKQ